MIFGKFSGFTIAGSGGAGACGLEANSQDKTITHAAGSPSSPCLPPGQPRLQGRTASPSGPQLHLSVHFREGPHGLFEQVFVWVVGQCVVVLAQVRQDGLLSTGPPLFPLLSGSFVAASLQSLVVLVPLGPVVYVFCFLSEKSLASRFLLLSSSSSKVGKSSAQYFHQSFVLRGTFSFVYLQYKGTVTSVK